MRDVRHAKAMATTLRAALKARGIDLTHSDCLELVARQFGLENWNVLSARIRAAGLSPEPSATPYARPEAAATAGPSMLPVLPVRDIVVFPGASLPLFVGRDRSKAACAAALQGDGRILLVAQRRQDDLAPDPDGLHAVGVVARILQRLDLPDGSIKLMVQAVERVSVSQWLPEGGFLSAEIAPTQLPAPTEEASQLVKDALQAFQAYTNTVPMRLPLVAAAVFGRHEAGPQTDWPGAIADALVQHLALPVEVHQQFLELPDGAERLGRLLELMSEAKAA